MCAARVLTLALAIGAATALAGCHSMAVPPFYEQSIDEGMPMREGEREVTWEEDIGLRPIFDVRHTAAQDRTEVHWLFPFGLYERKGEEKRVRLYPFYMRNVRIDPDGFKHDTTVVFPPGLFAGTHPVHGGYGYVFPFGGTMHGLFGKDKFVGVLFPLYGWTLDRGVETNHVLFPLISWSSGGDEKATQSGFRFLPFYGEQRRVTTEGITIYDRHTVMWPFVSWVYEGKNTRNPFTSIFIFPFWGRTRSDWRDDDTVLWPFFRRLHDKENKYVEWRAPFPFFVYGTDDGSPGARLNSRFDLWPLFGLRRRGDSYFRHFVLWPFERYERQETDEYTDQRFWFFPFFFSMSKVGKDPKAPWSESKTRFWPVVKYERKRDDTVELHALAPLWFDDPALNFDTILDPLYRIFRYMSRPDGTREIDLLLGAFSTRRKPNGASRWDFFGGLVGHGTEPSGEGKMRLFWFLDL